MEIPDRSHAMFALGLSDRDERCHNYIQLINSTILRTQAALQSLIANSQLYLNYINSQALYCPVTLIVRITGFARPSVRPSVCMSVCHVRAP